GFPGRSSRNAFGRKCAFGPNAPSRLRNIISSSSVKRTRSGAISAICAGMLTGRKPTLPILRSKTLTGPVKPLPTPGGKPEASPCSALVRRSERFCADYPAVVRYSRTCGRFALECQNRPERLEHSGGFNFNEVLEKQLAG